MGATTKSQRPDRFTPLLAEIRSCLGDYWTFYEECIDGVLDAATKQQDTIAWFEQMQQLVEGIDKVRISHEGILFLLRDMDIHAPERQSRGEGEVAAHGMYHSPPLSPAKRLSELAFSSIDNNHHHHNNDNMAPMPVCPPSSMNPFLPLRPLRPSTPAIAAWPPPCAPTPRTHLNTRQQQQQQQHVEQFRQQQKPKTPFVPRGKVVPFDFSATKLPGLTFPDNPRDLYFPREEVIVTENYEPPPPNPLRKASHDPVFFLHPTLKANIAQLFGYPVQHNHHARSHNHSVWQSPPALSYVPDDDDLAAWRKRSEDRADNDNEKIDYFDTLPPWNNRFDLDLD
ncbi:hypothetical protein E8E11_002382 [Didymella keratinophila]|nr:hypothetical protein E8E11_002382 [Didymella keratinophila]